MHLALASLALASAVALVAAQQVTPPPSVIQCGTAALTLQGGVAPYTVSSASLLFLVLAVGMMSAR